MYSISSIRGKNISDVLDMTINQAIEFFSEVNGSQEKRIIKRLKPLQDVGLGYIKLGQSSSTLSGGENQRVKLAFFLSNEKQESTLFIFDEPTTGLHFHDINTLLKSFNQLIERRSYCCYHRTQYGHYKVCRPRYRYGTGRW